MKTRLLLLIPLASLIATSSYGQYENRNRGMGLGALMGALGGAAIGEHNDKPLAGAAIGMGVGALAGAVIGDSVDANIARDQAYRQQVYNQQVAQGVSVQAVISMSQSRLSDDVMITHIHTNGVAYRPTPNDLIMLNQAGVSDGVIRAMQTARLTTVPAPVPVYSQPRVVVQEHYYVRPYPPPYHYYGPPRHYPYPRSHGHIHYGVTIGR